MPFIRTKKISGKEYAYLVENNWLPWGPRQKVVCYVGKVIRPSRLRDESARIAIGLNFRQAVVELAKFELLCHGFERRGSFLEHESGAFPNVEESKFLLKGRPIAIAMNEGFLCEQTLKQLLSFSPKEERDSTAKALANCVLEAGLRVEPEVFAELFEKVNGR